VAYVSLYRKYRPQSFADVVGQDHVTRTLVHAIEEDRLHHAYLFTGPRGTGKTSTARILAKAINCEQGPTPTPCNACGSCESITNGSSVDVIELDMASHGGVDDARELRERALFAPANSRRKVYILDEVHMASTAAFNALLKLVEEPPGHVLFAMATTDPQKVLPTILSRVQRLDLRRVSAVDVGAHVRKVCEAEGYTIDAGAVDEVVRAGDGSVRDTLSVLEQVLAYAGVEVTAEAVGQVLGRTPAERVVETVDRLAERDLAGLFGMVQGLLDDGHDLRRFTLDLVQHLRDLLVLQVAPDRPDLVDATDERRRRLQAQAPSIPSDTMLRAVDLLAQTVAEQRQGSPRLPLELALARLATPGADGDLTELVDRIARLEAGVAPAARAGSFPRARAGSSDVTAREASARSPGHTRPPSSAADADEASGGAASAASSADAAEASSGGAALAASSADAAEASGSDAAPPGVGRAPGSAAGSTAPGSPTEATGEARPPAEVGSSTGSAAVSAPDPATASDPVTTPAPTTASDPATSPSEPAASSDPVADLPSSGSAPSDPAVPSEPAAASEPVTPSGPATPRAGHLAVGAGGLLGAGRRCLRADRGPRQLRAVLGRDPRARARQFPPMSCHVRARHPRWCLRRDLDVALRPALRLVPRGERPEGRVLRRAPRRHRPCDRLAAEGPGRDRGPGRASTADPAERHPGRRTDPGAGRPGFPRPGAIRGRSDGR
jgi:DNA polymerase III subunit gamma/tau